MRNSRKATTTRCYKPIIVILIIISTMIHEQLNEQLDNTHTDLYNMYYSDVGL